jgi:hypothetical protein
MRFILRTLLQSLSGGAAERHSARIAFPDRRIAPHQFPTADTAPTDAVFVRCGAPSMSLRARRPAGRDGRGRGACAIGARPDGTRDCLRASIKDRSGDAGFGRSHQDFGNRIKRGTGTDQPLNLERAVIRHQTSNQK